MKNGKCWVADVWAWKARWHGGFVVDSTVQSKSVGGGVTRVHVLQYYVVRTTRTIRTTEGRIGVYTLYTC